MNDQPEHRHSRRKFLQGMGSAMALSGCSSVVNQPRNSEIVISEAQRKKRIQGDSTVAIIECPSYEAGITGLLKQYAKELGLASLSGKTVVIKPNMVEYYPDRPVTTDPNMVAAAAELADWLGAKEVIIGEGPGHVRDTEFLLAASGIGQVCSRLGLEFVDLNLDDLEKVDNQDGFTSMKEFFLPRTIMNAGAVISLPKLKAHHWVGMTASMKNLFGAVPGRKYGWPKNILHWLNIDLAIIDLMHMIKPTLAIVDAVVAMEGDGPISGTAKNSGFMAMGVDFAAVDATCARAMTIEPRKLRYLDLAGQVLGNVDRDNIKHLGAPLESVRQAFALPATFAHLTADARKLPS